jgi:phosphonate transport system substrate-binding protein
MTRIVAITLLLLAGCGQHEDLPWVSLQPPLKRTGPSPAEPEALRVGVAPVLSAVASFEHYNPLVSWMASSLGRPTSYVQRGTYHEINELTRRGAVDVAFVCTGPWLLNGEGLELLAVPEIDGAPHYRAVCLTQRDHEADGFEGLAGARFGFTDILSFTGRAYPTARLAQLGVTPEDHFRDVVQVEGHDVLLHMLAHGELDGGCVSSVVYDHYLAVEPALTESLRVFERSGPYGSPPVLVSSEVSPTERARLQELLLSLDDDPAGQAILGDLGVDRFIAPPDGLYDEARQLLAILEETPSP